MKALMAYAAQSGAKQSSRDHDLVSAHAALVKRIAYHLASRLPPSVQIDDLVQAGMIGLLEAAKSYSGDHGAAFETYAGIRIRGAMLDELRRSDWTPRSVHKKVRMAAAATRDVESRLGRAARDREVAEAMGIELSEYAEIMKDAASTRVFSYDELVALSGRDEVGELDDPDTTPVQRIGQQRFRRALADVIAGLPERERLVMSLYYEEELNLREVGAVLGVSESRVCQLHGQAIVRIRAHMADWIAAERNQ